MYVPRHQPRRQGCNQPQLAQKYVVCMQLQRDRTQHTGKEREGERERERERETGLTSNECSYSPFQSTTLPSSLSLFSVTPFPVHILITFSHPALPKKEKERRNKIKVYYLFCIPLLLHFNFSSTLYLLQFVFLFIYYFHFRIQFFDYCFSSIQLFIGSRHPPLLLLSSASELSISEFYWPLIELGICKICGFNCWGQKVLILVVDQPNYRFGSDRGRNSAIRWRCSEGSSTGSRRIGFWRFPREFMVCFLPISLSPLLSPFSISSLIVLFSLHNSAHECTGSINPLLFQLSKLRGS